MTVERGRFDHQRSRRCQTGRADRHRRPGRRRYTSGVRCLSQNLIKFWPRSNLINGNRCWSILCFILFACQFATAKCYRQVHNAIPYSASLRDTLILWCPLTVDDPWLIWAIKKQKFRWQHKYYFSIIYSLKISRMRNSSYQRFYVPKCVVRTTLYSYRVSYELAWEQTGRKQGDHKPKTWCGAQLYHFFSTRRIVDSPRIYRMEQYVSVGVLLHFLFGANRQWQVYRPLGLEGSAGWCCSEWRSQ